MWCSAVSGSITLVSTKTKDQLPEWLVAAPLFSDRFDGGRQLAAALPERLRDHCVVVGLARGGVQVAAEVARSLNAPLDVVAVRKVGHPMQPEYALGAVTPGDGTYLRAGDDLPDDMLTAVVERARRAAEALDRRLHASRPPVDLAGRTVVLADDGLATGATMIAALRWARARGASETVAAVPVAAADSAKLVEREASQLVCPHTVTDFMAVGLWYERFPQVGDDEVIRLLEQAQSRQRSAS
jgi:putative phosphoribosyl transferase